MIKSEKFNRRQKIIRDLEWNAIENTLKQFSGNFLDIGAGTGYAIYKADSLGFDAYGIEPCPNEHGVADEKLKKIQNKIQQGFAEKLPFNDRFFEVVYASHSLEHFTDPDKGLTEMTRVLKDGGLAIIIVPTGLMSFISLVSQYIFTTHRRIARFLIRKRSLKNFRNIFFPDAHGSQNATVIGEINDFRVKKWENLIGKYFQIKETILPCLYPYPDFPQFFPSISNNKLSSSVVFICSKKKENS